MPKNLGYILRKLRIEQDLNQKELSKGLCSVATLSRIEAGERIPDKLLFDSLITRLGKDSSKWELILKDNDRKLFLKRKRIEYLIWAEEWEELEKEIEKYKLFKGVAEHLQKQYVNFIEAILCKEKKQYEQALQYCYEGLKKTNAIQNNEKLKIKGRLSRNELDLFCLIGEVFICQKQPVVYLCNYWVMLLEYIEKFCKDDIYNYKFLIKVHYYLSQITYKYQYKQCIYHFDMGIEKIKKFKSVYYLKEYIEWMQILRKKDNTIVPEFSDKEIEHLLFTLKEWNCKSRKIREKEIYIKANNGVYSINEIIKNTRYAVGKTQEDMIIIDEEDRVIGDQSNLSKIENQKRTPRKKTSELYLEQLGLRGKDEYFYLSIVGLDFEMQEIRYKIDQYISSHNISEAKKQLLLLKEKLNTSNIRNKQYIKEIELFIRSEEEIIPCDEWVKELRNILSLTVKDVDYVLNQEKIRGFLTREELYLVMNIGCAYHDSGDYEKAVEYYGKLETYFYEYYPLASGKIYKTLLYNLSQVYGLMGEYEKSIEKSHICIFMDLLDSDTNIYCQAIYNIGWCYGKMMLETEDCIQIQQYKKKCVEMFKQSYLISKYYKNKMVEMAIYKKIKDWSLDDEFISLLKQIHI